MSIERWYIGLSSGSALAGVDAALVRVGGVGNELSLRLEHFTHLPFTRDLRLLLLRVHSGTPQALRSLAVLHRVLGEAYAAAARQVLEATKMSPAQLLAIGCPGHLLWHGPEGRYPATFGVGMAAVIAERTGLTTITDFASRDVVVGGQGYPLTALVDQRLFHDAREHRLLIHLGGVASVLSLPAELGPGSRHVLGFQAAPCGRLLDGLMHLLTNGRESFDPGGKHAVQGRCIEPILQRWLQHPVLLRHPPKCIPGDEFGPDFLQQAVQLARAQEHNLHDLLCTATHFIARAIVQAVQSFVPGTPTRILLSGGGVRNGLLWRLLEQQLTPIAIERVDVQGVPAEARKAMACGGLAALTMDAVPGNLSAATGAAGPRLLGQFTPGSSGNWARCLAWMAAQTAPLRRAAA
jgi:anhydro-N-acetylmuramic acid kinase